MGHMPATMAGLLLLGTSACSDLGSGGPESHLGVWITASWSGGAAGAPNDLKAFEPDEFHGSLCPAESVHLTNHIEGSVLNIQNHCTIPVTYYICMTKGGSPQPQYGLQECAEKPSETPLSDFKIIPLYPGNLGDYINSTLNLSVQIFYCTNETLALTQPFRCQIP